MTTAPFVSYAQNREDVILHRVLGDLTTGRYVDVGANDPVEDSVSKAFYDRGWSGVTVEPVHEFAERQRAERPRDIVVEAAINEQEGGTVEFLEVSDARLSTLVADIAEGHERNGWEVSRTQVPSRRLDAVLDEAGWGNETIHFLSIDTEGAEEAVLRSIDLSRFRPWVILVEATKPQSTEASHGDWEHLLLAADYRFAVFDGLSRFYLAAEKWDEYGDRISAPANVLDNYVTYRSMERETELERLSQATVDLNEALRVTSEDRDLIRASRDAIAVDRDRIAAAAREFERASAARDQQATDAIVRWRAAAFGAWSRAATSSATVTGVASSEELTFLRNHTHAVTMELAAMRNTLSWRITAPLRKVRRLGRLVGR
ncbi:methyltransferase, FkbM family [Nakamurella panacisegetis]|uniref:Methyltransferase, FkbM family n=1 Tax=Nakamurella panacisegetis TaxID=1090615 RepID=A0A1H0PIY9_9ACTN|nr:FkbM family methyltransferase [Nakamurella panacisegetis]SDP04615.1 methyltransferase, FkbM family [Nakamurella panacisegetis]